MPHSSSFFRTIEYKKPLDSKCIQRSFLFGDISIPITYLDALGVFAIESPDYPLTMKIDYSLDFAENANNLMEKLLKEYPELEE